MKEIKIERFVIRIEDQTQGFIPSRLVAIDDEQNEYAFEVYVPLSGSAPLDIVRFQKSPTPETEKKES